MLKRIPVISLLLTAWLLLCGMSIFPPNPTQVPKTKENFSATVYDASGVATRLNRFSIDGDTYLPANRGKASLAIPFDRIEEITFREGSATVRLKDAPPAEVKVDGRLSANGLSDYGPYQITLKEISRLVIHGKLSGAAGGRTSP